MNRELMVNYRLQGQFGEVKAHSHQEYEIYLFHQGTCRYLIDNQIYDLHPGDILLMDGLALHKPNLPQNSEYVRSHVHFSPDVMLPVLQALGATSLLDVFRRLHHCLIRPVDRDASMEVEAIFKKMSKVKNDMSIATHEQEWQLKTYLTQLLIYVNRLGLTSSQKAVTEKNDKAHHAENIASFIQEHYHERLSIERIASELNVSKSYVSHVFKEMTGYTIMEYVMATRLRQVKFLLEVDEKKSLQQIADECGFESVSHFSRFFKANVGMTARNYRQKRLEIYKRE
ncbi:transcriptional regulator [Gracilibacillus boraciitolerans JCM 21714]|uniref:Transcriptional regulator n=1 Tax=Gracilibacillus boraciitolerans JCM 21714 TaxID=1298598 RepID=W4VF89_9BACI|nr:AraC family transcriptional regulator [Gracilibacillus boraciitolerans]GAE91877.1 transcriptional regulator [Gracilibacillus boraciitolerans JCM 21714]